MARIRTVKPDLFSSFSLARASIPARLLFVGLFTEADDDGRLIDSPKYIAGAIFPHDEKVTERHVAGWLDELASEGCVVRYSAGHGQYLVIPEFLTHQRISHPTPSKLPPPPETFQRFSGNIPETSGEPPETFRPEREREREEEQGGAARDIVRESFERFWAEYPTRHGRKLGKAKAESQWKRLKPADRDLALVAVSNYSTMCAQGTYAKDAERWLRDRCFEEWLEPVAPIKDLASSTTPAKPKPEPCPECVDGWVDDPNESNSVFRCDVCGGTGRKDAA